MFLEDTLYEHESLSNETFFGPSGAYGYRVILQSNNTLYVSKIVDYATTSATRFDGATTETLTQIISEDPLGTYSIPPSCPFFVFKDTVVIEGEHTDPLLIVSLVSSSSTGFFLHSSLESSGEIKKPLVLYTPGYIELAKFSQDTLTIDGYLISRYQTIHQQQYATATQKTLFSVLGGIIAKKPPVVFWGVTSNGYASSTILRAYFSSLSLPFLPKLSDSFEYVFIQKK